MDLCLFLRKLVLALAVLVAAQGLGKEASAQPQAFYILSSDGRLYSLDRNQPGNMAQLVRTVAPPASTGVFSGLIYKDGYFYTTFGPTHYVVRFSFRAGEDVVLGQLPLPGTLARMTVRSDGTVWIAHTDSAEQNAFVRTVNLNTLALGTASSAVPPLMTTTVAAMNIHGLVFDNSDRLILHWAKGAAQFMTRFQSLSTMAWDTDCNALANQTSPCWYGGLTIWGEVTASDNGVTYIIWDGTQLRALAPPQNPMAVSTDYSSFTTFIANLNFPAFAAPAGLTLAPAQDDDYYYIGPGLVVNF